MTIQSYDSGLKQIGLLGARNFAATALNVLMNRQIVPIAARNGFCLENLVSQSAQGFFQSNIRTLTAPRRFFSSIFGFNKEQEVRTIVPVIEEVQFRYLLQQVILKHLPQTVLDRVFPNHNIDLDAVPFKILRVLVTASLFAAFHLNQYSCEDGGGLDPFIGGLIYGTIIEAGGSIIHTIILHMLWNQFAQYLDFAIENYLGL
ncbi:MAG: CPBP family intramembrane metalloprotease [Simkania sp.]|nr:CPBP family intramembrane metalloprotease [Simkania sp.]MCP5490896.1 CPBP family intramembrane metalloprotease [Chlamydiales bacterium]